MLSGHHLLDGKKTKHIPRCHSFPKLQHDVYNLLWQDCLECVAVTYMCVMFASSASSAALSVLRSSEDHAPVPQNKFMGDIEELAASYERKLIEVSVGFAYVSESFKCGKKAAFPPLSTSNLKSCCIYCSAVACPVKARHFGKTLVWNGSPPIHDHFHQYRTEQTSYKEVGGRCYSMTHAGMYLSKPFYL